MSSAATDTAFPAPHNTMGALFIGVIISTALWGAGSVQLYYYYNNYRDDKLWMKTYVLAIWMLDTSQQVLILHSPYIYLVSHYADPTFLLHIVSTLFDMVIVTGFVCAAVQGFFIWRIWNLSHRNSILTASLCLLCLGPLLTTIVYYAKAHRMQTFQELEAVYPISKAINVTSAVTDTAIAATLIVLLHRSRTGFKRSETVVNKLILFTINTGLLTSLSAIASLIAVTAGPSTFIYITFYFQVPRLYVNSLLATLNARKGLLQGLNGDMESGSYCAATLSDLYARPRDAYGFDQPTQKDHIFAITISETQMQTRDNGSMKDYIKELEHTEL